MICVDILCPVVGKNKKFRYNESCHLFSDDGNLEELHRFAISIGLKREWYQDRGFPHYDLTKRKRDLAVMKGAVEVTINYMVKCMKGLRNGG